MKNEYDVDFENLGSGNNGSLRWISLLVMAMVVFGFFWLMLYAYDNDAKPADGDMIASISPENGDYKIKPDEAGGMAIENKDIEAYQLMRNAPSVANEVEQVERLLPLAERPIVRDIPAGETAIIGDATNVVKIPQAVVADEVISEAGDNVDVAINDVINKQAAQVPAPIMQAPVMQAPIVQNVPTEVITPAIAAPITAPVEKVIAQPIILPKIITPKVVAPKIIAPKIMEVTPKIEPIKQAPVATVYSPAKPAQLTPPVLANPALAKTVPAKPAAIASNGGGAAYIQFAALRSAADAPRIWGELKAKNPELVAYSYYTEAVTTANGATLHRLRAKGFADRNQALSICSALKGRGQDCLVSSN